MTLIRPSDTLTSLESPRSKKDRVTRSGDVRHDTIAAPDALPLFREFLEERARTGAGDGDVDWPALWETARGSSSLEEAIGRMAMAADATTAVRTPVASEPASAPARPAPLATPGGVLSGVGPPVRPSAPKRHRRRRHIWAQAAAANVVPVRVDPKHVVDPVDVVPVKVNPGDLEDLEDVAPVWVDLKDLEPAPAPVAALTLAPSPQVWPRELPEPVTVEPRLAPAKTEHRAPRVASRRTLVAYTAFGWMRNIGAIVILFAAWQVWGTAITQHHAQAVLRTEFKAKIQGHAQQPVNAPVQLIPSTAQVAEPAEGSVVAELQIPALQFDELVVEGTAENDLSKGPGHYIGSAMPGQAGNVAIAGHRTTYGAPFYNLNSMTVGDRIFLTTDTDERLTYVVSKGPTVVSPKDVAILNSFGDNRLTLTTCNPRYSSTSRLVVVAELDQAVVATPAPSSTATSATSARAQHVPQTRRITTGFVGWRWSYLPKVLLVLDLLAALGLAYKKVIGHFGAVMGSVLLAPLWAAGLYILFGLLSGLLPASI